MKARDIMTAGNLVTFTVDTTIREIARTFRQRGISGAPVMDGNSLVGIVTQSDIIARHARAHAPVYFPLLDARIPIGNQREYHELARHILAQTARDIMTSPVHTVTPDADVEDVATVMVERRANPIPVTEDGMLVGIISHTDLIRTLEEAEEMPGGEAGQ